MDTKSLTNLHASQCYMKQPGNPSAITSLLLVHPGAREGINELSSCRGHAGSFTTMYRRWGEPMIVGYPRLPLSPLSCGPITYTHKSTYIASNDQGSPKLATTHALYSLFHYASQAWPHHEVVAESGPTNGWQQSDPTSGWIEFVSPQ